MSSVDFFDTVSYGGRDVEVNVTALVTIGPGGPDPSSVDDLAVKLLDGDKDITNELPAKTIEHLEQEAFERAYAAQGDDYD